MKHTLDFFLRYTGVVFSTMMIGYFGGQSGSPGLAIVTAILATLAITLGNVYYYHKGAQGESI